MISQVGDTTLESGSQLVKLVMQLWRVGQD